MPAIVDTWMQPQGRHSFVNVPRGGTSMVRADTASPSYYNRARGQAIRDDYSQAGAEAAALSAAAAATNSIPGGVDQAIRNNAIQSAWQQTAMHYNIRERMADAAARAEQMRRQQIATLAELALKGQMHQAEMVLRERGLDLDAEKLAQQADYQDAQLGLEKDRLALTKDENAQGRVLEREKLAQEKYFRTQEAKRQGNLAGANIRAAMEGRALERQKLAALQEYNKARLEVQRDAVTERKLRALMDAQAKGVDVSAFADDFDLSDSNAVAAATGPRPATAQTARRPASPDPDAIWDENLGTWVMGGF